MSVNISAFGLSANITASATFPNGFTVTEFPDDTDPLDSPDLEIAQTAMGLNGDMVTWTHPEGIEIVIGVIPGSQSDINLGVLHNANRVAKNKTSAGDKVSAVFTYPNGSVVTCSEGVMTTGPVLSSVSSSGRKKSKQYRFKFEQVTKAGTGA